MHGRWTLNVPNLKPSLPHSIEDSFYLSFPAFRHRHALPSPLSFCIQDAVRATRPLGSKTPNFVLPRSNRQPSYSGHQLLIVSTSPHAPHVHLSLPFHLAILLVFLQPYLSFNVSRYLLVQDQDEDQSPTAMFPALDFILTTFRPGFPFISTTLFLFDSSSMPSQHPPVPFTLAD